MKVQKVQEVLCSGFLDVLRLSSLRSRYLSVYEKVKLNTDLALVTFDVANKIIVIKIFLQPGRARKVNNNIRELKHRHLLAMDGNR